MLCFSLLDFLMPPLAFVFFYFLFSVSALHWFSSSTNHQHCSVLLCCNCNAHLYFHLITTVHTLIIREATNKIKANWIMWEYEQKNGGKETRSERKEGGAVWAISVTTQATHICYHTKETLFGFTAQTAKEARLTERYRHRSIEAVFTTAAKWRISLFLVFCKNCNIKDFIRGVTVLCLWQCFCPFCLLLWSMIYISVVICLASMCFGRVHFWFLVTYLVCSLSCPGCRGLRRSLSLFCVSCFILVICVSPALCSVLLPLSPHVLICSSCVPTCCPSFKSSLSARCFLCVSFCAMFPS